MSGSQRVLKIISILMIIWAIVQLLAGIFFIIGANLPDLQTQTISAEGTTMDMATASFALGVGLIAAFVINLIIGLLGVRGAKNPHKIGLYFVLCIIGLVLGLISLGMSLAQGTFNWYSLISLALIAVCTVLASKIKKQA